MNKILATLILLIVSFSLLAAEGFSSLEEQMTGREFDTAGLNKLSPQELDALNAWIRKHSLATLATTSSSKAATAAPEDDRGLKKDKKDEDDEKSTITSKLVGKFTGWDGQTVFKLENGMIWAQASKKKFYTEEIKNPEVVIKRGMFGSWHLQVEGVDKDVKVKRIQ
jgi:hypothetical protein